MKKKTARVLWFSEIRKEDIPLVGGKGANLGEMYSAKIPVPNGFCVTASAYFDFIKGTSIKEKIMSELTHLDMENSKALIEASKHIQTAILAAEMPPAVAKDVADYYHQLCGEFDKYVAVRSSATAEDLPDASFAGQQETYLNIKGYKDVVKHVQKCWASLFEPRAIFYRTDMGFSHLDVGIAVPIQLMVQSTISGIMFTVNPLSNDEGEVSIEAAYGLGQPVVSGELTPDQFIYNKTSKKITYKYISDQTWQLTLAGKVPVSKAHRNKQKMQDKDVKELAEIGIHIEKHYGKPQDIEWGMEGGKLYIVQSRPVTTLKPKIRAAFSEVDEKKAGKFILEGLGASPGVASGPVKIVQSASRIADVKEGDVLVSVMTNPDFVPAMKRASAIVTDEGGRTSHAAIVSRELGIPAVVGCQTATKILKMGEIVTVDGSAGHIFEGDFVVVDEKAAEKAEDLQSKDLKTATKIYMNLAEPELAGDMAKRNVDGIGLLRAEFMVAQIGTHPRKFIEDKQQKVFIKELADGLEKFAEAFHPRPVVYRATDFRTNEFRGLKGGAKYEKEEPNPMIGFRGASRYIEDDDVFDMEIEAIKHVRNKKGFKNLHMMIPFVRTVEQLREVKRIMSAKGLRRSGVFQLWMMVEVPSSVIVLEDFIKEGIDGVSIGSNDLTMLTLGVDRDNERVANVYNELDPAVLWMLERTITVCKQKRITCSICGQAPSDYPELVRKMVEWGITSVSVSPDVLDKTRENVYNAEKALLKKLHAEKASSSRLSGASAQSSVRKKHKKLEKK